MTLTKSQPTKRRNLFGLTLSDATADQLRQQAEKLEMPPSTVAAELLARALQGRGPGREVAGAAERDPLRALEAVMVEEFRKLREDIGKLSGPPPAGPIDQAATNAALGAIAIEIRALRRNQFNLALKFMRLSGLSSAEITDWTGEHLDSPPPGATSATNNSPTHRA
jgi:hypothetical protein